MPKDDVTRRRHVLLVDVTQAASEVSRLIHESRDLNLPGGARGPRGPRRSGPLGCPAWRSCCPNSAARSATGPRHSAGAGWHGGPMLRPWVAA
jgi:hypothetical protein